MEETEFNQLIVSEKEIENSIRIIRGIQVMLDRDLAMLYGVETRILNLAVKRNIERFHGDFMFQLTKEEASRSQIVTLNREIESSRSQNAILNGETSNEEHKTSKRGANIKYLPYAFTENGIAMLSGVLRSKTAIEVNIRIMRAFTVMRQFLNNNAHIFKRIETIEYNQLEILNHQSITDKRIDEVFKLLDQNTKHPKQGIFFDGQIYDAYSFVSRLIKEAKREIVLIDNYIDETVLTLLDKREIGVSARIYTASISKQLQLDVTRHNSQYTPIQVDMFKQSHDRFMCIDEKVYHIGASIKDLGKKWFAFSLLEDTKPKDLIERIG